jgi:hypothetical protein
MHNSGQFESESERPCAHSRVVRKVRMSGSFMVATAVRAVLLAVAAWGMVGTNAADAVAAAQTRRVA